MVAVMLFHVGVFALYGFCFWIWFLLDTAVLTLFVRNRAVRRVDVCSRRHLALSVALIALGGIWAKPPHLAWFDIPLA